MKRQSQILITISIFATVIVNYPFISVANKHIWLFGIPLLYVYLLCCCLLIVGSIYWIIKKEEHKP